PGAVPRGAVAGCGYQPVHVPRPAAARLLRFARLRRPARPPQPDPGHRRIVPAVPARPLSRRSWTCVRDITDFAPRVGHHKSKIAGAEGGGGGRGGRSIADVTHVVTNQPPPLVGHDVAADPVPLTALE